MKENLRRLQLIFRLTRLKPEMFYVVSIDNYGIKLQGNACEIKTAYSDLNFKSCYGDDVHFERNNIMIART